MIAFLALWLSLGTLCFAFTALKMVYLRWSDLGLIPFGCFWLSTSFWHDENGKRMWSRT